MVRLSSISLRRDFLRAVSSVGRCFGILYVFSFLMIPASGMAQGLPFAATQAASLIRSNSASLNGMASPNGVLSTAWIEWGTNATYGQKSSPVSLGNGAGVVRVSASVSGLGVGTAYSFRLVVSNALGVAFGREQRFSTGLKVAQWDGTTNHPPAGLTNAVTMAGGGHSLAVRNDGSVTAWGSNTYGESNVPVDLTNAVAVACGNRHSIALRSDGTVTAWGVNSVIGETAVPAGLSNVVAIATGAGHNLALVSDGTVVAWGQTDFGQAVVPAGLSNVVAIACGSYHSLAVKNDGSVIGWGWNLYNDTIMPATISNVVSVAGGMEHSIALEADGSVVAWGGVNGDFYNTWFLAGPGNTIAVGAGLDQSLLLADDGIVTPWLTTVTPGLGNVVAIASGWLALAPNVAPQTAAQSVVGAPNSDLVIALAASDVNGDLLAVRISSLPAAGTLYQYASGVRGTAIVSSGTVISDPGLRVIFAPSTNSFGTPYATFNYTANDGSVDSAESTVTINVPGDPSAFTGPATQIGTGRATLNGAATTRMLDSTAWFEWGTNRSYGAATPVLSLGAGGVLVRPTAVISNLVIGGNYHFRLVVSNAASVTYGAEQMFTTGRNVTDLQGTVPAGISNVVGIARGADHLVALRNDGTAIAWGGNGNGQTNAPTTISNIVQVAAGNAFTLALRDSGQIIGWGLPSNGQLSIPGGTYLAVAAGAYHGLGLRSDGTVAGWGAIGNNLNLGQVTPPAGLSNVVAISAGVYHSLALKSDGTVVAWGNGYYGQTSVPSDLTNVVGIAAGSYHSLALKADGTLVTWGTWDFSTILLPTGLTNIVSIGAGYALNMALTSEGVVAGGIGVPSNMSSAIAIATGNASDALAIANLAPFAAGKSAVSTPNIDVVFTLSGSDGNSDPLSYRITSLPAVGSLYQFNAGARGAAIVAAGTLVTDAGNRVIFAPALNGFGSPYAQFAYVVNDGQTDSPAAIAAVSINANDYAITQCAKGIGPDSATLNGTAVGGGIPAQAWFQWGTNSAFGTTTPGYNVNGPGVVPVGSLLTGLTNGGVYHFRLVVSNAAGVVYGAEQVFTTASTLRTWGYNSFGQAVLPAAISNAVGVASGSEHNLVLLNDGTVQAAGRNDGGQALVPAGLSNVVAITAGDAFSLALQAGGSISAWGINTSGQTTVPSSASNIITVAAGANHALALRSDGTVVGWGLNTSGQTTIPAGLSNVVGIAAGATHSLALKSDGTVVSWGSGNTPPGGLTNVVAIAANARHSLALKSNGTVVAWGTSTTYGDTLVPAGLTNVIAIAAGTNHNVALLRDGTLVFWGRNDFGQASPTPGISNVVAIAAGSLHDLALAPAVQLTFASTMAPTGVGINSAGLNGMATPGGLPSVAWFQWGTNLNYNQRSGSVDVGSGNAVVFVSTNAAGFLPYSLVHYRLVVSNAAGVVFGADRAFTTGGQVTSFGLNSGGQTNVPAGLRGAVAVSGGAAHSLALLNDGTITTWGMNNFGQRTIPTTLTNAMAIAAGANHNLALRADGTVVGWGLNSGGQTNIPAGLTNVVAVAGGDAHSLALKTDGTVVAWGTNNAGQRIVPPGLSNCVAIAAGVYYSLALKNDGTMVFWGSNAPPVGLSNGGAVSPLANAGGITQIAAGTSHGLGLKDNGAITIWGDNYFGQTNIPAGVTPVIAVSAGVAHSAALRTNGTVAAWGQASPGSFSIPNNLSNVVTIASGANHILAISVAPSQPQGITLAATSQRSASAILNGVAIRNSSTATAWFEWGTNGTFASTTPASVLNDGVPANRLSATLNSVVPGGIYSYRLVVSNSAGVNRANEEKFTTGLRIRAWGLNSSGQISLDAKIPTAVSVSAGREFSLALRGNGSVAAWGDNTYGQTNVPASLFNVASVAAGGYHGVAVLADGTVKAWGDNTYGQTNCPADLTNVAEVSAGFWHGIALRRDGSLAAWGRNHYGQTNIPANVGYVAAIAAYGSHNLVLKSDGTVVGWGDNLYGQVSVPASVTNVMAIATGFIHSLALKTNGTVVAWGDNTWGQSSVPVGLTNVIAIAAGDDHSLALKKDGSVVAWGYNGDGELNVNSPVTLVNAVAISGGMGHTLAVAPNRKPVAFAGNFSGPANHDLLVQFASSDADGDSVTYQVTSLPTQGSLYQYAGGQRGTLITDVDPIVQDTAGRVFFAPDQNGSGAPYASIGFLAGDGYAFSPAIAITINISAPVAPLIINSTSGSGGFSILASGDSNTVYCVWASTNLLDWEYQAPASQNSPGQFFFLDPAPLNQPQRFYRLSTGCQ